MHLGLVFSVIADVQAQRHFAGSKNGAVMGRKPEN